MSLEDARLAVVRGDLTAALAHLLACWRDRRVAPIGDAIDTVGAAAARGIDPPSGKTPRAAHQAWLAMARRRDPAERGVLLATVEVRLFKDTWERLDRLDHDDPRVAHRIADLVENIAYKPDSHELLWKTMFGALLASGDPRIRDRVRGFADKWTANRTWREWYTQRLHERRDGILPLLEARAYAIATPAEVEACSAIVAAIPSPAAVAGADDLLAAIYEDPDDDAPRSVYMDWLLERGDPRGDFIRLQLANDNPARQARLLKEHATKWLGPLATRVQPKTAVFERGFLATCHLREPSYETDDAPGWATVHTLFGAVPGADGCATSGLRRLANIDRRGIERLATLTKPLAVTVLEWDGPAGWVDDPDVVDVLREDGRAALTTLERIVVLPRLRRLELRGHAWRPDAGALPIDELVRVLRAPLAANLEELALPASPIDVEAWLALLRPTRIARIELRTESGPAWPTAWRHCFERGPQGGFSRLRSIGSEAHYHRAMQHYHYGSEVYELLDHLDAQRLESVCLEVTRNASGNVERQLRQPLALALQRHGRALDDVLVFF